MKYIFKKTQGSSGHPFGQIGVAKSSHSHWGWMDMLRGGGRTTPSFYRHYYKVKLSNKT
jgi:hypothetical protein